MNRLIRKTKSFYKMVFSNLSIRKELKRKIQIKKNNRQIAILNTALGTDNLGDQIIMYYIMKNLKCYLSNYNIVEMPTHIKLTEDQVADVLKSKYVLMCGTNILSPRMELYTGWRFDKRLIHLNNLILIGVGWWGYQHTSLYSKFVYKHILCKDCLQSVRDSQTLKKLRLLGINNAVNTNCLTMWGLEKKCVNIPSKKCDTVIFTVTAVMNKIEADKALLRILLKNYKEIYFWPQANEDLDYLVNIAGININRIKVIERSFSAYNSFLKEKQTDYIGSRLHGGIHALQNEKRTIIIAVDNRAIEIQKDTNIPVIDINDVENSLDELINKEWKTEIHLNIEDIKKWLTSFKKILTN